jgi:hypothetical protein
LRLAAPADEDLAVRDIWLLRLRSLLAKAHGDEAAYRNHRDRYCDMATSLGLRGASEVGRDDAMKAAGPMSYPGVPKIDHIRGSQNFVSEMARRYDGHLWAGVKRY